MTLLSNHWFWVAVGCAAVALLLAILAPSWEKDPTDHDWDHE